MEENKKMQEIRGKLFLCLPKKKKKHLLEKMGFIYLDWTHCSSFRNFRSFLCSFSGFPWGNAGCKRT